MPAPVFLALSQLKSLYSRQVLSNAVGDGSGVSRMLLFEVGPQRSNSITDPTMICSDG